MVLNDTQKQTRAKLDLQAMALVAAFVGREKNNLMALLSNTLTLSKFYPTPIRVDAESTEHGRKKAVMVLFMKTPGISNLEDNGVWETMQRSRMVYWRWNMDCK
ncbi:hypothetical protein CERZMDRAFT_100757 [Cercospora zeae-maydis SCOH1-5]|uniref:Uncharacterized protein n=1 Tax=Cercospora zeae-maydis SCOH1-5 TaxID=717836 RepID=A0A6A6F5B5_9PEZI|nr:hypothetical protein CERZMDRAFT_100757 [Cercospora zeae-maydis SCOH1-5]